jgi:hypothetical protein
MCKLKQTNKHFVIYNNALAQFESACPIHELSNGSSKAKLLHDTIDFRATT